jgi:putative tributyrin esterase
VAFCELKYRSAALGKQTAANIILPQSDAPPPYPVFYLLHGLSDDHTIWSRRTSIERYVQNLPLIVVMPDGGRGFYCDACEGPAFETAIIRDLIGYVDRMLPTKATREGRCIGGLSMGGYGAVKLALKFPEMFVSANSHSGALAFAHKPLSTDPEAHAFRAEMRRIIGDDSRGGDNDVFALAERLEPALRPALLIDCGTEDFLIEDNRAAHAHLEQAGYSHAYREFPGAHDWAYWDIHVQEALAFHARHLGIAG